MPRMDGRGALPVYQQTNAPPLVLHYPIKGATTIALGHRLKLEVTGSVSRATAAGTAYIGFAAADVLPGQKTVPVYVDDGNVVFMAQMENTGATAASWRAWIGRKCTWVTNSGATAYHRVTPGTRKNVLIVGVHPEDIDTKTTTGARVFVQATASGRQWQGAGA